VKVSGGEPREVQENLRTEPTTTVTVDDDGGSIIGAAESRDKRWLTMRWWDIY